MRDKSIFPNISNLLEIIIVQQEVLIVLAIYLILIRIGSIVFSPLLGHVNLFQTLVSFPSIHTLNFNNLFLIFIVLIFYLNKKELQFSPILYSKRRISFEEQGPSSKLPRIDSSGSSISGSNEPEVSGAEVNLIDSPSAEEPEVSGAEVNLMDSPSAEESAEIELTQPNDQQLAFITNHLEGWTINSLLDEDSIFTFLAENYYNMNFTSIEGWDRSITISNISILVDSYASIQGHIQDLHLAANISDDLIVQALAEIYGEAVFYESEEPYTSDSDSENGSNNGSTGGSPGNVGSIGSTSSSQGNNYSLAEKFWIEIYIFASQIIDCLFDILFNLKNFF